jgi:hypothetical protein
MLPILSGRLQTRIFVIAVVGSLWTLVISPFLPPHGAPLSDRYQATFTVLALVLLLGLAWEFVYQVLQQFRWEKDWPTLFGFLTGINEGLAVWLIVEHVHLPASPHITGGAFVVHFTTVWLVTWLFVNGPMRVPFVHWRFRGGRLV